MGKSSIGTLPLHENKREIHTTIVLYVLIYILAGLICMFFFLSYSPVEGASMENTIHDGQNVILLRRGYAVRHGEIYTVEVSDKNGSHILIKRAIALEGDKVLFVRSQTYGNVDMYICKNGENHFTICNEPYVTMGMTYKAYYGGATLVNAVTQKEIEDIELDKQYDPGKQKTLQQTLMQACVTVPVGNIYVLGDNRDNSSDSRKYGMIPVEKITGKVIKIIDKNTGMDRFMRFMFGF